MKILENIYLSITMFIQIFPSIIKWKISFSDSIKLIIEKWEHMDASLNMYNWYRRWFHYNRYIFANKYNYSKENIILDIACWFWYWSEYLSSSNKKIYWVDLSNFAIKYANKYHKKDNINYLKWDASNITINEKFDKIISFETIEHLPTDELVNKYLQNLKNHLKDDWLFFCSSPNKWGLSKYHFQDYNYNEFKNKLEENWFKIIESYKQNSWDIFNKDNHWEIWWIYKINSEDDSKNAEVILLVAKKC